jgi:hypothetical protein
MQLSVFLNKYALNVLSSIITNPRVVSTVATVVPIGGGVFFLNILLNAIREFESHQPR